MKNERLYYIDVIRGIAIFLVVLGHTYRGNMVQNWLYSFHMPLFFFISGWLYRGEYRTIAELKVFVCKKARSFLWPYLIFLLLNYCYWLIVERHFRSFDQGPLWFLPVLLMVECCVAIAMNRVSKNKKASVVFLSILFVTLIGVGSTGIEYSGILGWIVRCINGTVWYYIGFYLSVCAKKHIEVFWDHRCIGTIYILAALLVNLICTGINGRVDMYLNRFNNILVYIIAALSGIYFCMGIAIFIKRNIVLEYLGRYSLIIMCTHEPIKRVIIQVASILTRSPSDLLRNNIFIGLLIAVIVVLTEILVVSVLCFFSKITLGKRIHVLFEYVR